MKIKKIVIADGNNLGWMAFGITPLTHKGQRVEAIYVGLNMIRGYLRRFEPDEFYLVWDGGRDARRLKLYPDYKRRRKELSVEAVEERKNFFSQIQDLQGVMHSLGVVQFKCAGREADDVCHTLITGDKNEYAMVISTDKDFYQVLKHGRVEIYNPVTKGIIGEKDTEKLLGIPVSYFVDYRALVGDVSDNLPGVKGIGEKWAGWLINNIFEEGINYDELTKSQVRMVNVLFDGLGTFDLMGKLIRFKHISKKEMKEGRHERRPATLAELQEIGISICERYGFDKHLNGFSHFIRPFESLWRKNE